MVKFSNVFYDRYFILDKIKVYHLGTSINKIELNIKFFLLLWLEIAKGVNF